MLVIRPDQMEALAAPHRARFVQETLGSLAKVFPGDARLKDEAAVRALLDDACRRAEAYGIARERELRLFAYLVFEHGPGFEKHADKRWMETALRDASLDGQMKMDLIFARLKKGQR